MALASQRLPAPAPDTPFVESLDAASGEVIARFEATRPAEVPGLLDRARVIQPEWAALPVRERCAGVRRLRDLVFERREDIGAIISREAGKPRVEATFGEILLALDLVDFYARRAPQWLRPERVAHHNIALKAKRGWLEYEPWGVVGVISPWNYPFSIPMTQVAPALAAGNAVLLKPSELTPWCGALIGELIEQAGFPAGLVQVLQGGGEVGAALVAAGPDKVFFTGSVATGRRIAESCARQLIPSVLELGGKDAMIVLGDADLDVASSAAVWGGFTNCGQACLSVERLYVEQSVAEKFVEQSVAKTQKLRLGAASDPDAEVGPMIRPRQLEKVEQQLRDATARGARIVAGGKRRPELGPCFFEPTVVTGVDHSMLLMQEETFGPVLAIQTVADAAEAVRLANDSPFGLAASVWTGNAQRGREIATQLHAGTVMVNDVASYYGICEAPHGGRGASGWGRSHSRLGLLEMVQVKYVDVDRLPRTPKSWWFGYNEALAGAADRFVEFLFAPQWRRRLSAAMRKNGALETLFRGHRI
ncbi:MAG TPA: aldehyde dehydrogenase family protein [Candidatus Acidoferrales bacterium]|jgi:succinate-semialdehyde dehydrogenase/glutarate-semialdehyde dehydrogenase|nr:aldehyde dehydrogenase family protein [Candidatus Acidoferrales bacterium]